ncbi:MAG: DNA-3-methyladenine glycosylase [Solirubrobacteraceae bacterium]
MRSAGRTGVGRRLAEPRAGAAQRAERVGTAGGTGPTVGVEARVEVRPPGPYRLPGALPDGTLRRRGGVVVRLWRQDGHDLLLRAAQSRDGRVTLGARIVGSRTPGAGDPRRAVADALERWRFALAVDDDLRPFLAAHRDDPLIGPSLRARPWWRPSRRPSVFEALLCAFCEQLIAYEDAVAITRRIAHRHGPAATWAPTGGEPMRLWAPPDAATVARDLVPADLEACGLAPSRAAALHRAARELASGRIDELGDPDRLLLRLGRLPEIGSWTLALVATQGVGRTDRPPAGDLNLRKALGRMRTGDPRSRVPEADVDVWLAPYAPWGALAAAHLMARRPDTLPTAPPVAA